MPFLLRYTANIAGDIVFTGNTIGLSRSASTGVPGTVDSIGAYITTDTQERFGSFPVGTTNNFNLNNSAAVLRLPPGSEVLYAELVWAGTCIAGNSNLIAFIDNPVRLTTPQGAIIPVAPDPVTADTSSTILIDGVAYVRSANVTSIIQAGGAGEYAVGGIVATITVTEASTSNFGGWTLCVVYGNPALAFVNASVYVGLVGISLSSTVTTTVSGFATPVTGNVIGRLSLTAGEGDASLVGPQVLLGPTTSGLTQLFGPNNIRTNFFASQINNESGLLDTTGTFGTRNQINGNPGTNIVGGRQGWDITNINVTSGLVNNQTQAIVQFRTTADAYFALGLGFSIDINAPFLSVVKSVDRQEAEIGEALTYATLITNTGTAAADLSFFADPIPLGTELIPNSVFINGAQVPGADPAAGVQLGSLAPNGSIGVSFQVRIVELTADGVIRNQARVDFIYQIVAGGPFNSGSDPSNVVTTNLLIPALSLSKTVSPSRALPGQTVSYVITVTNTGGTDLTNIVVNDPLIGLNETLSSLARGASTVLTTDYIIPSGLLAGTTVTNTTTAASDQAPSVQAQAVVTVLARYEIAIEKLPDRFSVLPGETVTYTLTAVNQSNASITQVIILDSLTGFFTIIPFMAPGETRIFTVSLTVPPDAVPGSVITNTVTMVPIERGPVSDQVSVVVTSLTDLFILKRPDKPLATPGETVVYTVTVTNASAADVTNLVISDPTLGVLERYSTLAPGASVTLRPTFTIPGNAKRGQVFRNVATASADGIEPVSANADVVVSSRPSLGLTKAVFPTQASVGSSVTYQFNVANTGNVPLSDVTLDDPLIGLSQSLGDLLPGESRQVVFPILVPSGTANPFINDAAAAGRFETDTVTAHAQAKLELLEANFALIKTVEPGEALPGQTVAYALTLTNTGPMPLTDVAINDPLLRYSTTVDVIEPNQSFRVTIPYTVPPTAAAGTLIQNVVSAAPAGEAPQQASAIVAVLPSPAMSLTKVVSPGSALPGATVTYTITVMNTGNTVLTDIGVSDELLGLNDPFDLLEINEAKTYVIPFTVPLDAPLDSNIVNTSTAVSDTTEPVVATANLRIAAVPLALTLAKSVDRPLALPGETVLFTVTVANPEAQAISGIQLRDPLLGVNQALGTLAPGASLALPFTYDVPAGTAAGTTVVNTAFVASDQTNEIQASASFAVGGLPSGARLEKSFVPDVASPGQTVTAILTIFNTGNTDLTNVVLSDPLLGLSQQILILAAGASQTFAVPFPVPEQAAGTRIRNTAVLRTDQTGETTAEAELQVEPSIRVVLRKSASQSSALPGETVLYTVTLTNLSNAAITGVTVEDSLLGLIQTADTLPPGFAATVTLAFTVPDGYEAGTVLTNEAIVRANEIGEERAFSSITIGDAPVLRLRKLAFTRAAFPGQRIFFLIGGVNGGNVPLTDIGFDDPLLRLKGESALLGEGGAQFVLLPYVVPPGAPIGSAIVNTIVAGSDQIGEQTASVRIQIAEPPVAIEKAVARALLKTGETTEITLVVNNRRSIAAVDTVVADALARELTFVSGSVRVDDVPLPGADPNVGIPLGDILPGRSRVIRFRVEANFAPAGGKVANQAHAGFRLQEGGTLYGVDSNRVEIQIEEEEE